MVRIKLWVNTGFAGAKHEEEIEGPDEWETMSPEEREKWMDEAARDYLFDRCEFGAAVIPD